MTQMIDVTGLSREAVRAQLRMVRRSEFGE
jgi:hypothetical protein